MDKQTIILFGPPGAGKGTQAELLADKLGLFHLEASKVLEEKFKGVSDDSEQRFAEADGEKIDILKEKELWEKGFLCSPSFVAYLMKEKMQKLFEGGESIILSGNPRTVYEAEHEVPLLKDLYGASNVRVFLINISPEQTIFRNSHRKICELMRHPVLYNKETEGLTICPLDGSKLVKRGSLDDPETIKIRIKEYTERTYPMIEVFNREGIKVVEINGEQSVADVFNDILKNIKGE